MIHKLSDIPDFAEFALNLSHAETISNRICVQVCEWILKHGNTPKVDSKDPFEKKLGLWLRTQRRAKLGKGHCTFYPSNLTIAKKYGLPDLFDQMDREKESNAICIEYCKWVIEHGTKPRTNSKDPTEKKLGLWRNTQRQAIKGNGICKFYPSNLVIAKQYGLSDLFEKIIGEKESNASCHECCKWTKKHGKTPNSHSKDPIEKKYASWIHTQRRAKLGKGHCTFYPSNLTIAKKYGLPDMFELIDLEKVSNANCEECCKWTLKHGKEPSQKSKDPIEKKHGRWLSHQRQAKLGKGTWTFYPSNLAIAKKFGLPDFFELIDLEKVSNASCHECCKWTKIKGITPSPVSKDPTEKKLGIWLYSQRQAKKGRKGNTFYSSNLAIAKKYGLPDLFELIDLEKESNGICHECCKWTKKHGKTPSSHSKNPLEKKLGQWRKRQQRAKRGQGKDKFYPSNLAIAKKYGLPNLFESKKK